jgi:hypothetical protein
MRARVMLVLAAWFLAVMTLGAAGSFAGPPGRPPIGIAVGLTVPLLLFAAAFRWSRTFRDFVLTLDLRLVAAIQAWRWAGLGFLSLYAYHVLPAIFALPAGLGDMAVGVVAPLIVLRLAREPDFAASAAFGRWNLFGILDLVVAVTIASVSFSLATGAPGEISVAPMALLPLLVIPGFLVPVFIMLHVTALLQGRQLRLRTYQPLHGSALAS